MSCVASPCSATPHRLDRYLTGLFVIVSIDPVATVASLQDNEADVAAGKLVSKKYLFCVDHYMEHNYYGKPMDCVSFHIVSQRPPSPNSSSSRDELSFLPIWPATHPLGREPLRPSKELPWGNCMQHSDSPLSFVLGREHNDNPSGIALTEDDLDRVYEYVRIDRDRVEEKTGLVSAAEEEDSHAQRETTGTSNHDFTKLEPFEDDAESILAVLAIRAGRQPDADSDNGTEDAGSEFDDEPLLWTLLGTVGSMPPVVDIWFDLSIATELGTHDDLWKEMDEIRNIELIAKAKIETELQEIARKKARQLDWVRQATKALQDGINDSASINTVADAPGLPEMVVAVEGPGHALRADPETSSSIPLRATRSLRVRVAALGRAFMDAIHGCIGVRAVPRSKGSAV